MARFISLRKRAIDICSQLLYDPRVIGGLFAAGVHLVGIANQGNDSMVLVNSR